MLIKKEDARKKVNSEGCTVWEYDFPSKQLNVANAKLNGRYPEKGKAMNTEVEEIYFVIAGTATVHTEDGDFDIKEGDAVLFEKNKWYWVEAKDLVVVLPTSPTWTPEQYRQID